MPNDFEERNMSLEIQFVRYPLSAQQMLYITNLTAYESRILHYIARRTWGWSGKGKATGDQISQRQIEKATGIDRRSVRRCLDALRKRNIIKNHYKKGGRS